MIPETIGPFTGKYRFLSNFYPSRILADDGIYYPTVEHGFQAYKSLSMPVRRAIANLATPGLAKQMGRGVDLRKDWERVKIKVMSDLVYVKFAYHEELAKALVATGDATLIEYNTWGDTYWGIAKVRGMEAGTNWLGRILMVTREKIRGLY